MNTDNIRLLRQNTNTDNIWLQLPNAKYRILISGWAPNISVFGSGMGPSPKGLKPFGLKPFFERA